MLRTKCIISVLDNKNWKFFPELLALDVIKLIFFLVAGCCSLKAK